MSAFQCSTDELAPIVAYVVAQKLTYTFNGCRTKAAPDDADTIGRILQAENIRSLNWRYNRTFPLDLTPYVHPATPKPKDVRQWLHHVREAVECFDYQACEAPDYELSDAYRIVNHVRTSLLKAFAHNAKR